MKGLFLIGAMTTLLGTMVSIAWAGKITTSKSNTYRVSTESKIVSATATLNGANQTVTVFTTPAAGDFVLRQVCTSFTNGGIRLAASDFGPIAHIVGPNCQMFDPGVSVPENSEITCSTTRFADPREQFCAITGFSLPPAPLP
ncbi:MAG: hypothetical protein ACRESZ_05700 [Methylococcales bacterium]